MGCDKTVPLLKMKGHRKVLCFKLLTTSLHGKVPANMLHNTEGAEEKG